MTLTEFQDRVSAYHPWPNVDRKWMRDLLGIEATGTGNAVEYEPIDVRVMVAWMSLARLAGTPSPSQAELRRTAAYMLSEMNHGAVVVSDCQVSTVERPTLDLFEKGALVVRAVDWHEEERRG